MDHEDGVSYHVWYGIHFEIIRNDIIIYTFLPLTSIPLYGHNFRSKSICIFPVKMYISLCWISLNPPPTPLAAPTPTNVRHIKRFSAQVRIKYS